MSSLSSVAVFLRDSFLTVLSYSGQRANKKPTLTACQVGWTRAAGAYLKSVEKPS
jgi:hypothetical protein